MHVRMGARPWRRAHRRSRARRCCWRARAAGRRGARAARACCADAIARSPTRSGWSCWPSGRPRARAPGGRTRGRRRARATIVRRRRTRPPRGPGANRPPAPSVRDHGPPATVFVCSACGAESAKWHGPVPGLRRVEHARRGGRAPPARAARGGARPRPRGQARRGSPRSRRRSIARLQTGIGELDRVLGGGLVPGSLVLLGGSPGHRQVDADVDGARQPRRAPAAARSTSPARSRRRRSGCAPSGCPAPRSGARAGRDRPRHRAGDARRRAARGLRDRLGADAARGRPDRRGRARSARCARSPTGSRGSPRRAASPCCSSATSPRRARWPARACSSTSSTACCSSRASASAPTARCAR